jgi:hypothetical protein
MHAERPLSRLARPLSMTVALLVTACGFEQAPTDDSDLNQLTEKGFPCVEYSKAEQDEKLAGMPPNFMRPETWTPQTLARARNALAGLPKGYLDYMYALHKFNNFTISRAPLQGSTIGVTAFTNVPLRVQINTQDFAADFAMQHEVGHVIDVALDGKDPQFQLRYAQLFQQESNNSKLRSYARSEAPEFFAEAFSNYYCGPQAQAFLKSELPKTYAFLQEKLQTPVFQLQPEVDPKTLSKDVFVAFDETKELTDPVPVYVSLGDGLAKAAICKDVLDACVKSLREDVKFSADSRQVTGRKLFKSGTGLTLASNGSNVFTVLGFDAQGALKAAQHYSARDRNAVAP